MNPDRDNDDGLLAKFPVFRVARGRVSWFGGPADHGVSPSEGLALFEPRDLCDPEHCGLFLDAQPHGTTGLARRLDPDRYYIACRWDYHHTPRASLRNAIVRVSANGREVYARPVDWGPARRTKRVADLSPGVFRSLALRTDDLVELTLLLK